MPLSTIIQVTEYEKLYYDDTKAFQRRHWEILSRYLENIEKKGTVQLFRIVNKGVQFLQYVGVIQAGNLTIEILPKTDVATKKRSADEQDTAHQQWHTALLQMLRECKLLPVYEAGNASLQLVQHSILDIYLKLFLDEAETLIHEGLHSTYVQQDGNRTALKGQLLLHKQMQQNSLHRERFYVRSSSFEQDNLFNQILVTTLQLVRSTTSDISLQEKAGRLLMQVPVIKTIIVNTDSIGNLNYNRKTERYRKAIDIAKMLLLNYRPDITGGSENVLAILFDMNALWEEWVYQKIKKEEAAYNITVLRQQRTDFWKAEHHARHKSIRPDIVIQMSDKNIIIDTKWKLIEDMTPTDDDLKQMFVYNLYWQCSESILLYPANKESDAEQGEYVMVPSMPGVRNSCRILKQSVFKDGRLNADFGKEILAMI